MNKLSREERINIILILYEIYIKECVPNDVLILKEDIDEKSKEIILDIYNKKTEIDDIIKTNLIKYTINRLNIVDLAIIELAVYELKYLNIAKAITINEALEITKIYSETDDFKAVKFNNKLLDNIAKYLEDNLCNNNI